VAEGQSNSMTTNGTADTACHPTTNQSGDISSNTTVSPSHRMGGVSTQVLPGECQGVLNGCHHAAAGQCRRGTNRDPLLPASTESQYTGRAQGRRDPLPDPADVQAWGVIQA
jgi:hypothetical protein